MRIVSKYNPKITEDFLNKEYDRITNTKWNMDKLNIEYWKNKMNWIDLGENVFVNQLA